MQSRATKASVVRRRVKHRGRARVGTSGAHSIPRKPPELQPASLHLPSSYCARHIQRDANVSELGPDRLEAQRECQSGGFRREDTSILAEPANELSPGIGQVKAAPHIRPTALILFT
ncbi:hypothetical protein SRHO_G00138960 [Serrasalmus rhombeus]